ncbi:hypothetical protein D9757_007716 [Collybiopsis confluens]|uniref:Transcription factor spt8 beta-propeller domain-containing protein n=1 Tax=Collybiopsis confluens TaxID=2823264 RepID=A0A8H5M152_9AGAR|nr:hypothetical protein D9757_007716 [Collybiopsis confluens]
MAPNDSEEEQEIYEEVEDDNDEDAAESENLEAAEDVTEEGDDDSPSEDSDGGSDDAEDEDSEPAIDITGDLLNEAFAQVEASAAAEPDESTSRSPEEVKSDHSKRPSLSICVFRRAYLQREAPSPAPRLRNRAISPSGARKKAIRLATIPRSLVVEAVCAIPHPVPTNALAASYCMTHLLTGSEDGYIRDYDIFAALNSKNFLSAPQRHHSGVVEGLMKAGQHRFWWENNLPSTVLGVEEDRNQVPVHSLTMHSDALWALAGTDSGPINLFTVRHEPGRLIHTLVGHRDLVSALTLDHDENSLFSASWDGEAIQWDLNTGQKARTFTSHGAQLTGIAVRPENAVYTDSGSPKIIKHVDEMNDVQSNNPPAAGANGTSRVDSDAKSDASFDPLFDDEPEDGPKPTVNGVTAPAPRPGLSTIAPPKGAPPLLDQQRYKTFSPDILMTTAIDGQIMLWDKRVGVGQGVGRLWMSDKTPPWCLSACWSADGNQIYAGRRNGTVEIYDVRQSGRVGFDGPRLLKTLRNPSRSGVVSCVVGFPDNKHIACASIDNIRLWNTDGIESDTSARIKGGIQFKVIPGHHGGYISQMFLDLGTGSGLWAINMADEFPRAEVIGIDLAPLQPRSVPPNCTFELCDLETGIPYPSEYFDFIHARSMHTGIRDYAHLLNEIARLLRPGGVVLLIEPDLTPKVDANIASDWTTLWETYRNCLARQGVDTTVPQQLAEMLGATVLDVLVQITDILEIGNIPVGFWPRDPHLLSVGQLQWLDYDLFLPALRPMFLSLGLTDTQVQALIENAQRDLYQSGSLSTHIHIVHASKKL